MGLKYVQCSPSGGPMRLPANNAILCDGDCNQCPLITHANSRMLTAVLNALHDRLGPAVGDAVYDIVQNHCPNLTVCHECRVDDFCHYNGCTITAKPSHTPSVPSE